MKPIVSACSWFCQLSGNHYMEIHKLGYIRSSWFKINYYRRVTVINLQIIDFHSFHEVM